MGQHTAVRLRAEACPSAGWGASSGHRGPSDKRRLHHLRARAVGILGAALTRFARTHTHTRANDHSSPLRTLQASPRRARSSLTTCFGRGSFTTCPSRPRPTTLPASPRRDPAPPRSQQFSDLLRSQQFHDLPKSPSLGKRRVRDACSSFPVKKYFLNCVSLLSF